MKKTLFLSIFAISAFIDCKKEEDHAENNTTTVTTEEDQGLVLEIEQKQNATMFFYTSTGCPGCGSWGMPAFASLSAEHEANVIPVGIHIKYNDPFITETSEAIAANRTGSLYTPQIHVGSDNIIVISGGYIDDTASMNEADSEINNTSSVSPTASCGSVFEIEGSTLNIKYGANFHEETNGEYYVAAYLLEDKLYNNQVGANPTFAEHNNVIRTSISDGHFGNMLTETSITSGYSYEVETSIELDTEWTQENLEIITIIWKKEGENYSVVNSSVSRL